MAQLWRREVTWAACHIPRVWPIQICFHFHSMTTRVDAIKKRNSLWLCKSYNQIVTNQQGILVINALCAVKKDQIKGNNWRGVTMRTIKTAANKTMRSTTMTTAKTKITTTTKATFLLLLTQFWLNFNGGFLGKNHKKT